MLLKKKQYLLRSFVLLRRNIILMVKLTTPNRHRATCRGFNLSIGQAFLWFTGTCSEFLNVCETPRDTRLMAYYDDCKLQSQYKHLLQIIPVYFRSYQYQHKHICWESGLKARHRFLSFDALSSLWRVLLNLNYGVFVYVTTFPKQTTKNKKNLRRLS